jgi:hypothetical protein
MRFTLSFERQATVATGRRRHAGASAEKLGKGTKQEDGSIMHQENVLDNYFETFYFLRHCQLGFQGSNVGCVTSQASKARSELGTFQLAPISALSSPV